MKDMKNFILILSFIAPFAHASTPIGTPNNGSLINSETQEEQGQGFMQLFREKDHIYATRDLITMLQLAALDMSKRYPNRDRLQIEDMSARNGGRVEGHGSHQNGLDVDLGYFKLDGVEHDPRTAGTYYAHPMATNGVVSSNFDTERNWELAKSLHQHGNVQKIFMDQTIKNHLCRYAKSINELQKHQNVLRSIRHVTNHEDHMHVRLRCPKDARKCRNLPEAPEGTGCP
jgi:penicillin-insensitive murein endopeptidase